MVSLSLENVAATFEKSTPLMVQINEIGFDWSFKPFQILVKILTGISLLSSNTQHLSIKTTFLWSKWFSRGHICFFFFVNLIINAMWVFELVKQIIPLDAKEKNEFLLRANKTSYNQLTKNIFECFNSTIVYLGIHLYFLYLTCWSTKWNDFWGQMEAIRKECQFKEELFRECRTAVFFVLLWMLMEYVITFPYSFYASYWDDYPTILPFYKIGMNLVILLDVTIQSLFMIIVIWTRFFLKALNRRLREDVSDALNANNLKKFQHFTIRLLEWKRHNSLICQFVDELNSLFGFVVLLFLYYRFVNIISFAFIVCSTMIEEHDALLKYNAVSTVFSESFKLCMVIYICHVLQIEGNHLIKSSLCVNGMINTNHVQLQALIHSTLTQVVHNQPIITAAGFFDVNLYLLPTFLGSVFTYLLIIRDYS